MRRLGGAGDGEEFRADRDAGDLGVAKPFGGGREIDRGRLNALADEAVGHAGDGVGLKGHGWDAAQNGRAHGRTGGVSADAEDGIGDGIRG